MDPVTSNATLMTLAVYSWPFLFSAVVGLIVWIWKERVVERTAYKFETAVNTVRNNFGQTLNSHMEIHEAEKQKIIDRMVSLERTVFGMDGGNGLRSDMKKVKHGIRALLMMRFRGDQDTGEFDIQSLMSELE